MSITNTWIYLASWQISLENQLELVIVFQGLVVPQKFLILALAAVHPLTKSTMCFLKETECWQHFFFFKSWRVLSIHTLKTGYFLSLYRTVSGRLLALDYWKNRPRRMLNERHNLFSFQEWATACVEFRLKQQQQQSPKTNKKPNQ